MTPDCPPEWRPSLSPCATNDFLAKEPGSIRMLPGSRIIAQINPYPYRYRSQAMQ
jgi:hypothetical protein